MSDEKLEIDFAAGKVSSSKIPGFKYFPFLALVRIARRFELGIERKKEKAWNAISKNQGILTDREFAIERAAHAAYHAMRLKAILSGEIPDDGDDHAAAIGWASMFLCEATRALSEANSPRNCSACGGNGKFHVLIEAVGSSERDCPACHGTGKEKQK